MNDDGGSRIRRELAGFDCMPRPDKDISGHGTNKQLADIEDHVRAWIIKHIYKLY